TSALGVRGGRTYVEHNESTLELEPAAYPLPENPDFLLAAQVPPAVFSLLVQGNGVVSAKVVRNPAGNVERLNHPHLPRVEHKPDLLRGVLDVRFHHPRALPLASPILVRLFASLANVG